MKLRTFILITSLLCFVGCSLIDDDLSVCGPETIDYNLQYTMKLQTHMQTTVDAKLSTTGEKALADTLKAWMAPIFSGVAHDLNMHFYAISGEEELRQHRYEIVNATQKSYTLYIPREDYTHLAVVNMKDNANMSLTGADNAPYLRISQVNKDTLPSHPTAVYTARLPMRMSGQTDQSYKVDLYMVSSAVALVIDTPSFAMPPMKVLLSGTATGFNVRDSVFTYDRTSIIRAEQVTNRCYAAVSLPSRQGNSTSVAPARKSKTEDATLWQLRTYVTLPDGKITETVLSVDTPLEASMIEIIRVSILADGSILPVANTHVGATVTLDWKDGSSQNVEI